MKTANVQDVSKILRELKAQNLIDSDIYPDQCYNCWGFVSRQNNFVSSYKWVDINDMEHYLETKTFHIEVPRIGDIAVFRDEYELTHTAIVYAVGKTKSDIKLIQKPGDWNLELIDVKEVETNSWYSCYGNISEYRRKGDKKDESI